MVSEGISAQKIKKRVTNKRVSFLGFYVHFVNFDLLIDLFYVYLIVYALVYGIGELDAWGISGRPIDNLSIDNEYRNQT